MWWVQPLGICRLFYLINYCGNDRNNTFSLNQWFISIHHQVLLALLIYFRKGGLETPKTPLDPPVGIRTLQFP